MTGDRSTKGGHIRPNVGWANLTPLEVEVAKLVAQDLTNGVIAQRLGKSSSHIARRVGDLYTKSGVVPPAAGAGRRVRGDRAKLVRWAQAQFSSEEKT